MPRKKEKAKENFMKIRNSRKLYLPIYLMVLILIGVVVFVKYNGLVLNNLVLILVGLFVLFLIKGVEVHRLCNSYEINDLSLVHTMGLFNRRTRKIDFFAISDIDFKQNFWQRLLNFGDVNVRLYSQDTCTSVKNINKPRKFADFLQKMINARRRQNIDW